MHSATVPTGRYCRRSTMRAIGVTAPAGELALLDMPVPEPADGDLLVRVRASSINPIDVLVTRGEHRRVELEFPVVPGWDFAGTVERVGRDVAGYNPGDDVFGYWSKPTFRAGAWAEYVAVPADGAVARKPEALSYEEAAAVPLAAVTAAIAVDAVALADGERALVIGAGGAVGHYAVQLAAARRAYVIATARPADERRLRELGAAESVDYSAGDVAGAVRERHPGGVPVLIDIVDGPEELARLAELVPRGGRVASARFAARRGVFESRGVAVHNVAANDCDPELLGRVATLIEAGELTVMMSEVRPLEELPAAVADFRRGGRGKIVISVAP